MAIGGHEQGEEGGALRKSEDLADAGRRKRRTLKEAEAEIAVLWNKVRDLQVELQSAGLDSRRFKALSAQRIHWGWGQSTDEHIYCCAVGMSVFREKTLTKLADTLILHGHSR